MQVTKKHNKSNRYKTISFIQLISDLELSTGRKQNRPNINFRLLNREQLYANDFTYFIKI